MTGKRVCGSCTLCCKLLPVVSLGKGANTRCQHQHVGKGCAVYGELHRVSPECRLWSCMWLVDPDPLAARLQRPDRAHYVIDIMPDISTAQPHDGGPAFEMAMLQVWIDPAFPDAVDDPALRAWIEHMWESRGLVALIRIGSRDGYVLAPPAISGTGKWERVGGSFSGRSLIDRMLGAAPP